MVESGGPNGPQLEPFVLELARREARVVDKANSEPSQDGALTL